jgi:hypothetical protein
MSNLPDAGMTIPTTCKDGESQSCTVAADSGGMQGCGAGKQECQNGTFGPCVATNMPAAETCNGQDDDCDGTVDEESAVDCYPSGMVGCPAPGMGSCQGLCAFGRQDCKDGKLLDCAGAKTPAAESCDPAGGVAADENCDGTIDEGCMCTGSQAVACYNGPAGTAGTGICKNGMQTCTNGSYGPCMNAVTPGVETCANEGADDDCNGVADDIKNRNAVCMVPGGMGICATGTLQCKAGNASLQCVGVSSIAELCNGLDDDCDGKIDNGFDLMNDAKHCGSCTNACAAGDSCCGGKCVNTQKDNANCGGCGASHACAAGSTCTAGVCTSTMPTGGTGGSGGAGGAGGSGTMTCSNCTADEMCCNGVCTKTNTVDHCGSCTTMCGGMAPACCNGKCEDLASDSSCGACDNKCGLLGDSGVTCKCGMMSGSTAWQCIGVDVAGVHLCVL